MSTRTRIEVASPGFAGVIEMYRLFRPHSAGSVQSASVEHGIPVSAPEVWQVLSPTVGGSKPE